MAEAGSSNDRARGPATPDIPDDAHKVSETTPNATPKDIQTTLEDAGKDIEMTPGSTHKDTKMTHDATHTGINTTPDDERKDMKTTIDVFCIDMKTPPDGARIDTKSAGVEEDQKESKDDCLEEALSQLGYFGWYQRYLLLLLCLPNVFSAMYSLNYVFVADLVPFRCIVPECEQSGWGYWNSTAASLLPADQCRRYQPLQPVLQSCDRTDYHHNETIHCDAFAYENLNTIFSEFDLACREWLRTLVGSVRNAALPLALILTGYISDKYGRRTAFCIFSACAGVLGIIKPLSPNYQMYVAMEFFEAALGYGFNSAAYVMMIEIAHPSLRATFACATGVAYGAGGVLFALVAWHVQYWRHLLLVIYTPALLLPLYWLLLDESPRWLHVTGRIEQTKAVIRKAARWNKKMLHESILDKLGTERTEESKEQTNPWLLMVRSRLLMTRFLLCCWCWVATTFVYYGLTINSVSLSGNKYSNFALNMSMEIVASILIMMALERFGRKRCIFVAFLLCGVACVIPYFTSHSQTGLSMFFVGKLAITFAFNSVYVFTAELFPTRTRSSALAACSLVGRIGSILAPQTPLLSLYVQALLYGACSLTAALAVLAAPETRRARLPQQVTDAETLRSATAADPPEVRPPRPPPARQISAFD